MGLSAWMKSLRSLQRSGRVDLRVCLMIAKAEVEKKAVILAAEAELAQARARAEGEFLAESRRREGEAQGIQAISDALQRSPQALLALESIKQQPEIAKGLAGSNGLMIVPSETAGLLGAAASMVKGLEAMRARGNDEDDGVAL